MLKPRDINEEITTLTSNIQKLHVDAWRHRVNHDSISLQAVKRLIRVYQARIKACEWALTKVGLSEQGV